MSSRATFAELRAWMDRVGFRPSRRLGQNFLLDPSLHRVIVDTARIGKGDFVLEVGAGLGLLTEELVDRAGHVLGVEIDSRLCSILRERADGFAGASDRLLIVEGDVLAGDSLHPAVLAALADRAPERFVVVANLPYAISGPFLARLPLLPRPPDAMALLVQLDLARRLHGPGEGSDGALAALLQAGYRLEIARKVGREVFRPRPRVDSALLHATRREGARFWQLQPPARAALAGFLRRLFRTRRKQLGTILGDAGRRLPAPASAWLRRRPEELSGEELMTLWQQVGAELVVPDP